MTGVQTCALPIFRSGYKEPSESTMEEFAPKKKSDDSLTILRGGRDPEVKKFSKGGSVSRGDGKASRGRTKGRFI